MCIKQPTTFEQQIDLLKKRGMVIEDETRARNILESVNYYKFTGYAFEFKNRNNTYSNISFDKLYRIYLFDKRFKMIILYALEIIEHHLKTKLAYFIAHNYGALGYIDSSHFKNAEEHTTMIDKFEKAINRNKKLDFVKHHINNYDKTFPVWVAVELFTFGMLYNCYKNLETSAQKQLAYSFNTGTRQLESWIECCVYLRNMAAHYIRLFRVNIQKTPKTCKNHCPGFVASNRVYDIIYMMRYLLPDKCEWNEYIIGSLSDLFNKYNDVVSLSDYGFPTNWKEELFI